MYEELTKRLRECTAEQNGEKTLWHQAADAIEKLQQIAGHYEQSAHDYFKDVCYYLERMPKWIPVTERLPEDGGCLVSYLVNTIPPHRSIDICYFAKNLYKIDKYDFADKKRKPGFYQYDSEYGYYERAGITHWMPLPQPPESEGE